MAHPIYTFLDKKTDKRYFQIWDTVTGLPETVPMNLLTFLHYWGMDSQEKISALYRIYPRLIRTGTSLSDCSFDELPNYLKRQAFDYLSLGIDLPTEDEQAINVELEELFRIEQTFFEFYSTYSQMIESINPYPKRPLNYYLSWSKTKRYFDFNNERVTQRIDELIEQFQLPKEVFSIDQNGCNLYDWLVGNLFVDYSEEMAELFSYLGGNNLIPLDAIPHVIRNNASFHQLFADFGMEDYLPETPIQYDVHDFSSDEWVVLSDVKYTRQFVNMFTFEENESELMGLRLQDMTKDELKNTLSEKCYVYADNLVNVKDRYGNLHLPMKYTSHFTLDSFNRFLVLAPFDRQCYDIFDRRGKLVEEGGYYDFYFINETIGYFQYTHNLSWIRWEYNDATKKISTHNVQVDDSFHGAEWHRIESEYQDNLSQVQANHFEEQFPLLELVFGKSNDWYSLYLMNTSGLLTANRIHQEIIEHLNILLFDEIDLTNPFEAGIQLYKTILSSNRVIEFLPGCLNRFTLTYDPGGFRSRFQANYRNDDFNDQGIHDTEPGRAVSAYHALHIIEDQGHYQKEFIAYFKVGNAPNQFRSDCEEFVHENPVNTETNNEEFGASFIDYLLAKGYEEVNAYTQRLDVDSIRELLGIELNEEGRFPQPDRTQLKEEDELPF
jgi:hypothetical protein